MWRPVALPSVLSLPVSSGTAILPAVPAGTLAQKTSPLLALRTPPTAHGIIAAARSLHFSSNEQVPATSVQPARPSAPLWTVLSGYFSDVCVSSLEF